MGFNVYTGCVKCIKVLRVKKNSPPLPKYKNIERKYSKIALGMSNSPKDN